MKRGKVKWFNDAKGYGFVEADDGADVFVHYSAIDAEGYRALREGEAVLYEAQQTPKGLCATRVEHMEGKGR